MTKRKISYIGQQFFGHISTYRYHGISFRHCEKISSILHSALCILHSQFIGHQPDKLQFFVSHHNIFSYIIPLFSEFVNGVVPKESRRFTIHACVHK